MIILAEIAPLAGRLAFAAVFFTLVLWLTLMPRELLGESDKPLHHQVRTWAVVIALIQMLVYLFWR